MASRPLMHRRRTGMLTAAAVGVSLLAGVGPLAGQGVVEGTVIDAETRLPVVGAMVLVEGTSATVRTGTTGSYRFEGIEEGPRTLWVRVAGYGERSLTASILPGRSVIVDFILSRTPVRRGDGGEADAGDPPRHSPLPFAVKRLSARDLPVPAVDVASLLAGKVAGLSVISGSGQPGEAASLALRGPGSINTDGRSMAPLVVVDGVIQSENATLSDIGTLDVDHVQILKGAAAGSLYGSRGQNGVILVATRRGGDLAPNSSQLTVRGEYGFGELVGDVGLVRSHPYLMNPAGTKFIDSVGQEVDFRDLNRRHFGSAVLYNQMDPGQPGTPSTAFANQAFPNELTDHMDTFFDPGETVDIYAAVADRTVSSGFRISADQFRESGIVSCSECIDNLAALNADRVARRLPPFDVGLPHDEGYERQNVRLNVDKRFGNLDIAVSGFYSRSDQDNKAESAGVFGPLTFMSPAVDLTRIDPSDGYPEFNPAPQTIETNPLYHLAVNESREERARTMASLALVYSPARLDWLTLKGNASFDRTDIRDYTIRPWGERPSPTSTAFFPAGSLQESSFTDEAKHASVTVGARTALMNRHLGVRGGLGLFHEDQRYVSIGASGFGFAVPDLPNFDAVIGQPTASNEARQIRGSGVLGTVGIDYRRRYIVDGLVRRDGSSLFGEDERWQTYYRTSVAWRVSEEAFWNVQAIDDVELRFAVGTAGGRPNFAAQYETYEIPNPSFRGPGARLNQANTALRPELTTEREAGLRFVLLDDLAVDMTYAWSTTDDQILLVRQPAFTGFLHRWTNGGEIEAESYELSLRYVAIDQRDIGLRFRLHGDRIRHRVSRLDIRDFMQDRFFFVSEGRSLGELWGERWATSCADLAPIGILASECTSNFRVNDDGLLVWTGGAEFTDGFDRRLWGTDGTVATSEGEATYWWGFPILVRDYSPACVARHPVDHAQECSLTTSLPLGSTTPDFNAALGTNFRYGGLSLHSLLEASVGQSIYNWTAQWALRELRGEDVDQTGKPLELNKPVGYASTLYSAGRVNSWFVEDGSWLKLREFAVSFTLPPEIIEGPLGGAFDRVTLSLIGRNLLTVTGYRGYDPEVGLSGRSLRDPAVNRVDSFGYPNFRTITFAAEVVF